MRGSYIPTYFPLIRTDILARMTKIALTAMLLAASLFGQARKPAAPKSLRVYVIDCGWLNIPDTAAYQLKLEELATKNMSVGCFLIVHPKGTLFWDAGAVPET